MDKLQCSLVDILVKVGLNEDTGLVPVPFQPESEQFEDEELYSTAFEPHILAAISADACLFPYAPSCRDLNYPPQYRDVESMRGNDATRKVKFKVNRAARSLPDSVSRLRGEELRRTLSRRRSCRKVDLARPRRGDDVTRSADDTTSATSGGGADDAAAQTSVRSSDLPLTADVLNSLTSLCFPDGALCQREEPEASVHFLVFTDVMGQRSYATCLTYYTRHSVTKEEGGTWQVHAHGVTKDSDESEAGNHGDEAGNHGDEACNHGDEGCYLPSCIVLISKSPYFSLLKDLASRLYDSIHAVAFNTALERPLLQQAALQLCRTPVPPSGLIELRFVYADECFTLHAPESHTRPVFDLSLHLLFQHFTPQAVIQMMGCVLLQQRIILMSAHYSLLTVVAECIVHLMYPFAWHLTYVPLLSWNILELVEAPGTFIMGCHVRYSDVIGMVEDVVLVDIDCGAVDTRRVRDLPPIPQLPADDFCQKCRALAHNYDVIKLNSRTQFSYAARMRETRRRQVAYNNAVTSAALHLHVTLFRGMLPFIKPEKRFFNKEKFLSGLEETDRPFYLAVLGTELFGTFLKERMAEKRDDWTMQEERMRGGNKHLLLHSHSSTQLLR